MKNKWYPLIAAAALGTLVSCESIIDIDLPAPEEMVVVDGYIESGDYARVTLTKSMPYFSQIDLTTLQSIVITDATVFISDGLITDTLVFTIDPNSFPPVYYKGTNPALIGASGKTYYLTVWTDTDTLTSLTTIPAPIALDSIFWKPDGTEQDTLGFGWGHLDDPDTLGNIYRLFVKRQDYAYYVPAAGRSTFDDRLFNGQSTDFNFARPDEVPFYLSPDSVNMEDDPERFYFKRGDTIYAKFCTLDVTSYKYIRTYEIAARSFGNPFSAPTFVRSNINGGLGGWVGYAVTPYMYVVPQ